MHVIRTTHMQESKTTNQRALQLLIEGCLANDRRAQQKLFQQFAGWALTICRRYINTEEKAKEALNDGFLRVFTKINTYDSNKGSFKAWMARVFINCALTTTKREAFNNSFSPLSEMHVEPVSQDDFLKMDEEELLKFMKPMPMGYKTVFNMYIMDGYSHKEIGQSLNISEITSRSQLRKAKLWIKDNVSLDQLKSRLES